MGNIPSDYLTFLKYCLDIENRQIPKCVSTIDWHALLEFARKQAIIGIYWRGIERLGNLPCNKPTPYQILPWISDVRDIRKQNDLLNEKTVYVNLGFHEEGFNCSILKGQGNALFYPDPTLRTPGDIDIWVWPKKKLKDYNERKNYIIKYAQRFFPDAEIMEHHVDFPMLKDVNVEIHFTPLILRNPWKNKRLQNYWETTASKQFSNVCTLAKGETFNVPSYEFNIIFQLLHMYKHLLSEGLGLRQVIDYYYLLKKSEDCLYNKEIIKKEELINSLKLLGVEKFCKAIMWILHEVLGLDQKYLLMKTDEREGKYLLEQILVSGNFGNMDVKIQELHQSEGHINRFIKRERFRWRLFTHYPSESFWGSWFSFKEFFIHKIKR